MSSLSPPIESVQRRGARLIARFIRTHPMPTAVSVVGAVAFAAAAVGSTIVVGRLTDELIQPAFRGHVERRSILLGVAAVIAVGIARGVSVVVRRYFAAMLEARMQVTLRTGVVDKYLSVPMAFHQSRPTGELLARAEADVSGTTMLIKPLPFSIGLIALVAFALASLIAVDWTYTLIALTLFPTLTVVNRVYTTRVEGPSARVQRRLGDVSAVAHESFDGALAVKTLGIEARESERFAAASAALREDRLHVARLRASFEPLLDVLPNLGTIALFLVGAWRIGSGESSAGELVQAATLFSILGFPMRVFGFFLEELPRAVVSVERVDEVLVQPDAPGADRTPPATLPDGPLGLELRGVTFGYDPEHTVLHDVSFAIAPGERVALVGATGSGKSTINHLTVGLAAPSSGEVLVGGVPASALAPDDLHAAVALVFQTSFLFAMSLRDNIVLDAESSSGGADERLRDAAHRARVDRFIPQLAEGWDTVVGERGVTLSGGQRQRVALARALMRRPRILLLDDATSAVDPTVEASILDSLRTDDLTLLIVAHRLSTIRLADRVVFVENGAVRCVGTHDELLDLPSYAALVHAYEDLEDDSDPDDATEADDSAEAAEAAETAEAAEQAAAP